MEEMSPVTPEVDADPLLLLLVAGLQARVEKLESEGNN